MDSQEDRLSALPDHLILHILSSLELQEVIATSILSPRWRYLWTSVPSLDLGELSPYTTRSICLSLAQFNSPKIRRFRACFFFDFPDEIDMWIKLAVDRSVEEVDMSFEVSPCYKVVGCLLDCGSLKVLKLSDCVLNLKASRLCLPSLKLLHLNGVKLSTLDSSECPVLERLILKMCNPNKPLDIYAPSNKLGYLKIHDYHGFLPVLTIFAPYVCSVIFKGYVRKVCNIKDLTSLRTTVLKCENSVLNQDTGIVQLLQSVFHASALELSEDCVESVACLEGGGELPPSRTTCMKLKISCSVSHLDGMSRILICAPYLEKLILDVRSYSSHFMDPHLDKYDISLSDLEYSLSTIHSLKIVEVNITRIRLNYPNSYDPSPNVSVIDEWEDNKLLKSIVNSGKVLEKITISTVQG